VLGWKIGEIEAASLVAGLGERQLAIILTPPSDAGDLHVVPLSQIEPASIDDVVDYFSVGMEALLADAFFLGASVLPLWSAFHEALDSTRFASPDQQRRSMAAVETPAMNDEAV
jgi:hypothetical protein